MVVFEHIFAVIGLGVVALFMATFVWLFRHAKELTPVVKHITLVLKAEAERLRKERQKEEAHDS